MDQKSSPNSSVPVQTTSPEEDATLLAIEALEARSINPNPRPLDVPRSQPILPRPSAARVSPKVIEPVIAKPPVVAVAPSIVRPAIKIPTPASTVVLKPKKALTTSEKMNEALAGESTTKAFQFFANQSISHKAFIVAGGIIVLIGIGIAGYFVTR